MVSELVIRCNYWDVIQCFYATCPPMYTSEMALVKRAVCIVRLTHVVSHRNIDLALGHCEWLFGLSVFGMCAFDFLLIAPSRALFLGPLLLAR